ncbi:hypothetical protein BTUL_0001g01300 [Botrytis tulipae]|uniref:U6 snRNA-associated Sm-like protein LSm1 n=3 Tax=Botrytis TaxID=33196 RepID=A0A4Z1FA11_9HELO|nr:uncharacterized protein EAE97_004536 [Botrytis byssoidea]KAF7887652.1 hypothetical protein EAF00_009946 [Botryotinia globosa]KAF7947287.1 hypothetical protein EAE97_004536 [Botrytis byssoidea]TGO20119.1 hypothetical protein BTUL_0001g01300 [Botrytis tulipae]TGO33129.1 hypothetical protein BHYA_0264g00020 [Botrytis hyacinthi]
MDHQPTYQGPEGGAEMPALGAGIIPPPPNQQLPAQMFTTAAQLLDLTDKKLMISLRDGRKLIGILRSWDQFANIVLQSTVERIFIAPPPPSSPQGATQPGLYADIPRGLFLVRGENVLLLGEIDLDKDDEAPPGYEKADAEVVHKLDKERRAMEAKRDKNRLRKLAELGFEGENSGEAIFG